MNKEELSKMITFDEYRNLILYDIFQITCLYNYISKKWKKIKLIFMPKYIYLSILYYYYRFISSHTHTSKRYKYIIRNKYIKMSIRMTDN